MILPIDDKYQLAGNRYSWSIQEARGIDRKTGEIRWESVSWFPTLAMAINELHNRMVRCSSAETLDEALNVATNATATIVQALTPTFEVKENPAQKPGPKNAKESKRAPV